MNEHNDMAKELQIKKRELDEAINQYPAPIPACDEQFDYLIKERARILQELKALQKKYPKP